MNILKIREDFQVLKENKIIYFDNAASSLKPRQVVDAMNNYYYNFPVNIHRGTHRLSRNASIIYQETRECVSKFIGCKQNEVIFTQNSTDAINLVMYSLYNSDFFKKGDEIILSVLEHHSNIVPWLFLSKKLGVVLRVVDIKKDFTLDLEDFNHKLSPKTKLIAITHASNTTGTLIPINKIVSISKKYNKDILTLIDASQSAPHLSIDFKKLNCDFLVFTAHKMLGPTGVGCLIGKQELLEKFKPYKFGGDMIGNVSFSGFTTNTLPYKFEAGTPNISGVFGLKSAIDYLQEIGFSKIQKQDSALLEYALKEIQNIKDIELFNPRDSKLQAPILLFRFGKNTNIECLELSALLDDIGGIATRAGMHCAEPIVSRFDKKGLCRASFYFYNTFEEIDVFISCLKKIQANFNK